MLAEGEVVAGRYRVLRPLAEGGFGAVLVAWDERMAERVALKVVAAAGARAAATRERFAREARLANRLGREARQVVRARDWGEAGPGRLFLAMDLVEGARTLDLREGPLGARVARVRAAAAAVADLHRLGVVHRDLKPANLLVDAAGALRVTDFGLAKAVGADVEVAVADAAAPTADVAPALTGDGAAMGTPPYMPPEQFEDAARVDARADVYALGALLFQALTAGGLPYEGGVVEVARRQGAVRRGEAVAPRARDRAPTTPAALDDLCARALDLDAARRPADAGDFLARLDEALAAVDPGALLAPAAAPAPAPDVAERPTDPPRRPRSAAGEARTGALEDEAATGVLAPALAAGGGAMLAPALAALLLLAGVVAGGLALHASRPRAPAPTPDTGGAPAPAPPPDVSAGAVTSAAPTPSAAPPAPASALCVGLALDASSGGPVADLVDGGVVRPGDRYKLVLVGEGAALYAYAFQVDARGRVDALRPGALDLEARVGGAPVLAPPAGDWFVADDAVGAEVVHLVVLPAPDAALEALARTLVERPGSVGPAALTGRLATVPERALVPAPSSPAPTVQTTAGASAPVRLRRLDGPWPARVALRFEHLPPP